MPEGKRVIVTIECRMGSTRLPGKVMLEIDGKTILQILAERVRTVDGVDAIVLATTTNKSDDCIADLAKVLKVQHYRGSEEDVLSRVLGAADAFNADVIVELTGDNPLVDPEVIRYCLDIFLANDLDYLHNRHLPGYPIGMDVQIFTKDALQKADRDGNLPEDREHVSWYFRRNPKIFRNLYLLPPPDLRWPELRLTLDEEPDFGVISAICQHFSDKKPVFTCADIINFCKQHPEVTAINSHVKLKPVNLNGK